MAFNLKVTNTTERKRTTSFAQHSVSADDDALESDRNMEIIGRTNANDTGITPNSSFNNLKKAGNKQTGKSSGVLVSVDNNGKKTVTVAATKCNGSYEELTYSNTKIIGNGSFGIVFRAENLNTGKEIAIKKVLQDRRFKNRELQIMRMMNHPNICMLYSFFYCGGEQKDEIYLHLVLEFVPETVYRISRLYQSQPELPLFMIKLFSFQLYRCLGYIHSNGICHRDIKPQNLLVDPVSGVLKLCDFGSAKVLIEDEPNVAYICSRFYRAPELIFGAQIYTESIDIWSAGCVVAELLCGSALFAGENTIQQLVEIISVLGTPTIEEIKAMNPNYVEYQYNDTAGKGLRRAFSENVPQQEIEFISKSLQYNPCHRIDPFIALGDPYFDELRNPNACLPNGSPLPPLFNFSDNERRFIQDD